MARPVSSGPHANATRLNKHRPLAASSKHPVTSLRLAPGLTNYTRKKALDPRFDHAAAKAAQPKPHSDAKSSRDDAHFRSKYAHVFELQKTELAALRAKLADSKAARKKLAGVPSKKRRKQKTALRAVLSADEVDEAKERLNRLANQVALHEQALAKRAAKAAAKQGELAAIDEGKKPYFKKERTLREDELVAQYDELKRSGKLEAFMAKRRKQLAAKQRRGLPGARETEWYPEGVTEE